MIELLVDAIIPKADISNPIKIPDKEAISEENIVSNFSILKFIVNLQRRM